MQKKAVTSGMLGDVWIFLLLLFPACVLASSSCESVGPIPGSEEIADQFIVSFRSYATQDELSRIVQQLIGKNGWKVLPRKNRATEYPTDFIVIEFEPTSVKEKASMLFQLEQSNQIRSAVPERRHRTLFSHGSTCSEKNFQQLLSKHNISEAVVGGRVAKLSFEGDQQRAGGQRELLAQKQLVDVLGVTALWHQGYTGSGVRVGVFDTGLSKSHPYFKHIEETSDWTDEQTAQDLIGHGTFVAGLISSSQKCLGMAPDATIYSFRVFNSNKVSFTSWFLDAFNYAIHLGIDVLNLSIGGPDFMDRPFVDKIQELSANNVVVVCLFAHTRCLPLEMTAPSGAR